jgi:tetratricopeptide (TPR) repeat protein
MTNGVFRGTIFLSHSSLDKDSIKEIYRGLDQAAAFYDIRTMAPGQPTIDAMKEGVSGAAVYVLFHSEQTNTAWVDFEKSLAEIQAIVHSNTKILVCPINGSTYRSLPQWMQRQMTTTEEFKSNDIVRIIQHLYQKALLEAYPQYAHSYPGREALKQHIAVSLLLNSASTGRVINALVLTGVQGMGRGTLAAELIRDAYKGMRPGGPIFEMPAAGDAVDWHLQFKFDLDPNFTEIDAANEILEFDKISAADQAKILILSLRHWGKLNQVVTIRHRFGLRDKGNNLRPWFAEILEQLKLEPTIRLILLSERQLPKEHSERFYNVQQYALEELPDTTIQYILSDRIDSRYLDLTRISTVSEKIHGHPATANYVIALVNGGRSLESLSIAPDLILAFQDRILSYLFESGTLSDTQKLILKLLSWFPKLSASIICAVFNEIDPQKLMNDLWELGEFSLIDQSELGRYRVPTIVASTYRRVNIEGDSDVINRVSKILTEQFNNSELNFDLIDSLLIAVVASGAEISNKLQQTLTAARIEPVIEKEYFQGNSCIGEEAYLHYRRCDSLANLAMKMAGTDFNLENILYYGADSNVRMGILPVEILKVMRQKGFLSADYIEASYLYYNKREYEEAARILHRILPTSGFRLRNVRLLTKIYLRMGKFPLALDTLKLVTDSRLLRDSGLVAMKLKALRGTRSYSEADALLAKTRGMPDDYGDLAIYEAAFALRQNRIPEALAAVERAKNSPNVNLAGLSILQCACEVESGNNDNLAATCALARSMRRDDDAAQLLARSALVAKDWKSAESYISQVKRKDWFDLNVELRALDLKLLDENIKTNLTEYNKAVRQRDKLLVKMADSVEGTSSLLNKS